MVSEPGDAVGKSWPKESGSPHSRFRGTAKRRLPNRTADAVAAVPKACHEHNPTMRQQHRRGRYLLHGSSTRHSLRDDCPDGFAAGSRLVCGRRGPCSRSACLLRRQRGAHHWRDRSGGRLDPQSSTSRLRGFLCGSFASFSSKRLSEHVSAEGPSRKRSKDSQIEVVAFDSTLIEVTTDIEDILENLRCRFGATLVVE
jgi:hypothetical protein